MNLKQITLIQGIILGLLFIVPFIHLVNICPYKIVFPYEHGSDFEFAGLFSSDRIAWVIKEEYKELPIIALSIPIYGMMIKYTVLIIGIVVSLYYLRDEKK